MSAFARSIPLARSLLIAVLAWLALAAPLRSGIAAPPNLDDYLRLDKFGQLKLSPDGTHFAATIPGEENTFLAVIDLKDMKLSGHFKPVGKVHVTDFWWVSSERLLISVGEKSGYLDAPSPTGEIYAMDADGKHQDLLVGYRAGDPSRGRSSGVKAEYVFAIVIDPLPDEERFALIATTSLTSGEAPYTKVERLDVRSGRRLTVGRAPVPRADFVTDSQGRVRFARGAGVDNKQKTYYRRSENDEWTLIGDESKNGLGVLPLGFSPDGAVAYVSKERARGPDAVYAMDPESLEMKQVLRGAYANPAQGVWSLDGRGLIGMVFMEGAPVVRFFDDQHPDARLLRALQASFPGYYVGIDSVTADGRLAVLHVTNDRTPADYYLLDTASKRASHLVARRDWIDPEHSASIRPIALKARDGLPLHGYLTLPHGTEAKNLPLIVNPHGGPFNVADTWGFDTETQMLAAHGYAVLQVNFRGSGGYGAGFEGAGIEQWGGGMIDDITDAVRWTIEQGIADAQRICIYGASYGGYASLMSVAREPELYRCAVGYVGIYDIPMMFSRGDIQERRGGMNYLREVFGKVDPASISPSRMADRIKVPVFLAAGGEDDRAPAAHTKAMEKALQQAGVPVKSLIFPNEAHGFAKIEHQRAFYSEMLAFLAQNLGAGSVEAGQPAVAGKAQ